MQAIEMLAAVRSNLAKAIVGKEQAIELVLTALVCGGHVLIEDVPGVGKTTLVAALARSLGCTFARIQFTPDVLPSDVTGFTMFNINTGEKELHLGGILNQMVLADEINRTSPKTQSSLLEVMQEGQVTIDGTSHPVPAPFMVLATQNPIEFTGTYPLPEAQLDRFFMRIEMGYPTAAEELDILERHRRNRPIDALEPVAQPEDVLAAQRAREEITCAPSVVRYIVEIAQKTRAMEDIELGVSPRGAIALLKAAQGSALLRGSEFVTPDDVQRTVLPVLGHRIVLSSRAGMKKTPAEVLRGVLRDVTVPKLS